MEDSYIRLSPYDKSYIMLYMCGVYCAIQCNNFTKQMLMIADIHSSYG